MKKRFSRPRHTRQSRRQRWAKRLLSLPDGVLELASGGAVELDGQRLEPAMLALCRHARSRATLHGLEPPAARRRLAALGAWFPQVSTLMDKVEEQAIPGPAGELTIRVYSPADLRAKPPALVFFHAGGWVLGSLDSSDAWCRLIASQALCKVISVDYRLAPEHPYPAAVDDAMAAFQWVVRHAEQLRIDAERVAVGGDSAGGNLAAIVAATGLPCAQVLVYPVTCARRDTASYGLFAEGFGLERALMDYFFDHYLGDQVDAEDPRISPLRTTDFASLPPSIVATAGFDVLRDEGDAYAERLKEAGVAVAHLRFPSLIHSFSSLSGLPGPRRAMDEIISELAALFHRMA